MLYEGKIGCSRQRKIIDAVARVICRGQEAWAEGNIAGIVLMDVKGAFNHVS